MRQNPDLTNYDPGNINEIRNGIKIKLACPEILQRHDSECG